MSSNTTTTKSASKKAQKMVSKEETEVDEQSETKMASSESKQVEKTKPMSFLETYQGIIKARRERAEKSRELFAAKLEEEFDVEKHEVLIGFLNALKKAPTKNVDFDLDF